jgi:short-subunit dehydrogenase
MTPQRPAPSCVFITGATGGIGAALAKVYAGPGRTLILHGREPDRLTRIQRICEDQGARVDICLLDLSDLSSTLIAVTSLADRYPIDLAIVNAGITHDTGPSGDGESWEDIERVMTINANAAMATVSALLPSMRQRKAGQIALISSLSAWYGLGLTPAYCASKAALKAYGEALGGWLAPQGIGVAVVLPGFVRSAMSDRFPGPRPFLITPDQAALRIRDGLERDRPRISFPQPLALGMWCLALLPAGLSRWILGRLGYAGWPVSN